tara:strand:+ start:4001 stop:4810 length:810 start_codon:yes stop_codon:yes gene_type:complete
MRKSWMYTALCISQLSFAGDMGTYMPPQAMSTSPYAGRYGKVITLSLAPAWYGNQTMTERNFYALSPLTPEFYHTYYSRHSEGVVGAGELFFALNRPLQNDWSVQFGIVMAYSGNGKLYGDLAVGQPIVARYPYSFRLSNGRVGLKGKLISDYPTLLKPYVSASINAGFNRAWDYTTSHAVLGIASRPQFEGHTSVAFTYTLGMGVQANLTPSWQVGVGYEFADWGKYGLNSPDFVLNNPQGLRFAYRGLHASYFYTHALQVSLSYMMI